MSDKIQDACGELFTRVVLSIVVFVIMANMGVGGYIAPIVIGMILEIIVLIIMDEVEDNLFKEILYWGSQLLIFIPIIMIGFQMLSWPDSELNSWLVIDSIGYFGIMIFFTFLAYGIGGITAYVLEFASFWVYLLICLIVFYIGHSNRALLIFNIVISFIGLAVTVVFRLLGAKALAAGSNE